MRAYLLFMLCLSLFDLRGQRIAKIAYSTGAGVHVQPGAGTIHYIFDDLITGYARADDSSTVFAGFLTPIFISSTTPSREAIRSRLRVFPNPFINQLKIQSESVGGLFSFLLLDVNGRIVFSGKGLSREHEINTSRLVPGIFLLRIRFPDGHFEIHKLIKL